MTKKGQQIKSIINLFCHVDVLDFNGIFGNRRYASSKAIVLGNGLKVFHVGFELLWFAWVNAAAEVEDILSPKGVVWKRLHLLNFVEIVGHMDWAERRYPASGNSGFVSCARQTRRKGHVRCRIPC